jgi:cell division initiation protein
MTERLTPVDVSNYRFGRSVRGYSVSQVDEFMRRLSADLEATLEELAAARQRAGEQERELQKYRAMDATLRDSLVLAQKTADETRAAAHLQADAELLSARARAHEIELSAREQLQRLTAQVEGMRQERRKLARGLRAQLIAHLDWLDRELDVPDAAAAPDADASLSPDPASEPLPASAQRTPQISRSGTPLASQAAVERVESRAVVEEIRVETESQ